MMYRQSRKDILYVGFDLLYLYRSPVNCSKAMMSRSFHVVQNSDCSFGDKITVERIERSFG